MLEAIHNLRVEFDARHAEVKREELFYEGGLEAFVRWLDRAKQPLVSARSTSERLVPPAIAATVPIEQGQITIPADLAEPEAGFAPRSPSG